MKTVLCFGEILWDLLPDGAVLGGAVFNCSYRLHALGNRVLFVSRIGEDELGRRALAQVRQLGLDTAFLQSDPIHPTGTVPVALKDGIPDFFIVPNVAYDFIEPSDELLAAAAAADGFVFGTLVQRSTQSQAALHATIAAASRALKFLDINLRKDCFSEETVRWSLGAADVLKLNDSEVLQLIDLLHLPAMSLPQFAEYALETFYLQNVIITLGEKGVFALSVAGERCYVPGYRVPVADTVGAGDACSAGLLHALSAGEPLAEACELGNILGALTAAAVGATQPILPSQIETLRRGRTERILHPDFEAYL